MYVYMYIYMYTSTCIHLQEIAIDCFADTCIDLGGGAWVKFMCSSTRKDATVTYGQFTDALCTSPHWPAIDLGKADGSCREVPEFSELDMAAPLISPFAIGTP